jgi:RimJ/RimL family protein N-acetyltransferase
VSTSGEIPEVRTERLLLRALQPEDVDTYHQRLFADPEVMRFLPGGEPLPRERLDGVVERGRDHWARHGYGVWVVCSAADGQILGQCGLRYVEEVDDTEILYAYARSSWGRGVGTEAAAAALGFGFDRAKLDRIVAFAVPGNRASTRIMEKVGMTYEAEARLWDLDLVRYGISSPEWSAHLAVTSDGRSAAPNWQPLP